MVLSYAIEEIGSLVSSIQAPLDGRNPVIRYISALFAELAYYHIPEWELDSGKRVKLVPCDVYRELIAHRSSADVLAILRQGELSSDDAILLETDGTVIVGQKIKSYLFIGIRGTHFRRDWKVNLRSRMAHRASSFLFSYPVRRDDWLHPNPGLVHHGFNMEANIAGMAILKELQRRNFSNVEHIFLSGHSLGGAISVLIRDFLRQIPRLYWPIQHVPMSVCIFGAPRYGNASAAKSELWDPPVQVRRPGDMVPILPPKFLGYADYLAEYDAWGFPFCANGFTTTPIGITWQWMKFATSRAAPHCIENYRRDAGRCARANGAKLALGPLEKLTERHLATV